MTLTADYARTGSNGTLAGSDGTTRSLTRSVRSASANVDLPIASRERGVLGAIGTLSANATLGVSSVSNYGSLLSRYLGLTWTPVSPVQVTASLNVTQNAPDIAQLTQPVVTITNVAFFDFATGTNALVTLTSGGNADLAPERRRVSTFGATWKPMKARELRLALNYIETRIDDQTVNIVRGSPALLAAFPERFRRGADGAHRPHGDALPLHALRPPAGADPAECARWRCGPHPPWPRRPGHCCSGPRWCRAARSRPPGRRRR